MRRFSVCATSVRPTVRKASRGAAFATTLAAAITLSSFAVAQEPTPAASSSPPPPTEPSAEAATAKPDAAVYPETIPVPPPKEEPPKAEAGSEVQRFEDVVVTATKREKSAREIAGTVNALHGKEMENAGLQDIGDIVQRVPGVNIYDSQTGEEGRRITIRGISADFLTAATAGIFVGDIPLNDAASPLATLDVNAFDMDTVEVLKGPVGTLFGGSALNGAVRYIFNKPELGVWQAKAFGEMERYKFGGTEPTYGGAVNVPIFGRDDLAVRMVGFRRKHAGVLDATNPSYTQKDSDSMDQNGWRAMLRWTPGERWNFSLLGLQQWSFLRNQSATDNDEGRFENAEHPQPSTARNRFELYSFSGSYSFDWADLVLIAGALDKKIAYVNDQTTIATAGLPTNPDPPRPLADSFLNGSGPTYTQELRLVSTPGGNWDWLVGVFNYRYSRKTNGAIRSSTGIIEPIGQAPAQLIQALALFPVDILSSEGNVNAVTLNAHTTVTERAAFGELNWRFWRGFELTGGLRGYRFSYDGQSQSTIAGADTQQLQAAGNLGATEKGLSPKASLSWKLNKNVMTYATVARGFRFGGINISLSREAVPTYKSDSLWNYEAGFRTQWFDRTLIFDASAYRIDWKDAQIGVSSQELGAINQGGIGTYIQNVARVKGRGVESTLRWLTPLRGLSIDVSAAWSQVRTAAPFTTASNVEVPEGTPWPLSPKWQISTTLGWNGQIFGTQVGTSLLHLYNGQAFDSIDFPDPVFGYSTYTYQLTLAQPQHRFLPQLAFNINNLTDKRGLISRTNGGEDATGTGQSTPSTEYIPPRNYSLRLTYEF